MAGRRRSKEGIQRVVTALLGTKEESQAGSMEVYRLHVHHEGSEAREWVVPGQTGFRTCTEDEGS